MGRRCEPGLPEEDRRSSWTVFRNEMRGWLFANLPAKFELVVNLKTAKALALNIPQSLLVQATEIIQ